MLTQHHRYRKAVSTKGHEVFALVSEKSTSQRNYSLPMYLRPRARRSQVSLAQLVDTKQTKRDMKIVDLFMADDQLLKKEKADQRLREYLSEKTSRRRKSSGLAQAHSRLLRKREEDGQEVAPVDSLDGSHYLAKENTMRKQSSKRVKQHPPTNGQVHRQVRNYQFDSSSSESSDSMESTGKRPVHNTSLGHVRKIAKRGSITAGLGARQSLTQSVAEDAAEVGSEASDNDSEVLRSFLTTAPIPKSFTGARLRSADNGVTFHPYSGPRGGAMPPCVRDVDLQREYRSLGRGLKVDWRLEKAKQVELRKIMKEEVQLHAGPPIEAQRGKQEMQEEVRRVSSLASMNGVVSSQPHRPEGKGSAQRRRRYKDRAATAR